MICKSMIHDMLGAIAAKAKRLDVTERQPQSVSDLESACIGYRMTPRISSVKDTSSGAEIEIGPVTDGVVMKAGTPKYWVLSSDDKILATGDIGSSKKLRVGVAWTMPAVKIQATS